MISLVYVSSHPLLQALGLRLWTDELLFLYPRSGFALLSVYLIVCSVILSVKAFEVGLLFLDFPLEISN